MKILLVIPARYASTRFPGKPLALIGNRSMIRRVWEQARKAMNIDKVIIATDDERILHHVKGFGAEALMTSRDHGSGTHRCEEVLSTLESAGYCPDVVVNLQGDEPFLNPDDISLLCSAFGNSKVVIATLKHQIRDLADIDNPSVVKVVSDIHGNALYFSRHGIPYFRNPGSNNLFYKHIGIYAFKPSTLHKICQLPESGLELAEGLEQLRWLENGYTVRVIETPNQSYGIDNPWDIDIFDGRFPVD